MYKPHMTQQPLTFQEFIAYTMLRDVLGYHAAEVAQMLDATQESVQSALKRARATVDSHLADSGSTGSSGTGSSRPARQPDTAAEHRLVARLTDAMERADLDALIELDRKTSCRERVSSPV